MKKFVQNLGVLASMLFASQSFAQINGITITPAGATGDQEITISVDVPATCNANPAETLQGTSQVRLHAGLGYENCTVDMDNLTHQNGWQNVVAASETDQTSWFTLQPSGKWTKTITPNSYFGAPQGSQITYLCFVINGGDPAVGGVGGMWSKKAANTKASGVCDGDFFVPFPLSGAITGNADRLSASLAVNARAYPNPASATTTFSYDVLGAADVSLKVYDLMGSEVATVVNNEKQTEGTHLVRWNSSEVPAGVYTYTVAVGNKVATRKLVITH